MWKLKENYYTLFFENFLKSPELIGKLFENGICKNSTVKSKMFRGKSDFHYSENICCKWYNNKPNVDGMSGVSKVMRRAKGSETNSCLQTRL